MEPTLPAGSLVLCESLLRTLRRGDIVVVRNVREPSILSIKRLAALPGDPLGPYGLGEGTVPDGQCVVLGDNPDHSGDSRLFGPVPLCAVIARHRLTVYRPPR